MYEKINEDLKSAMKEKDTFKLSVLRMLKSALQLEQIAKKHELQDNEVIAVLKKQVKLRKDSIIEYRQYNKADLVANLEKEISILSNYLPAELSEEEIINLVEKVISENNPNGIKDMGKIMKIINEQLANQNADMSIVTRFVKEKLGSI